VHRDSFIFELNDDLDPLALGARREIQQGMLIEAKLSENAVEV
jgi:hypothetical protein